MIDAAEFLDVIFGDIEDGEHVCVSRATLKKDKSDVWWSNYLETDRQWCKWRPEDHAQAWYFNVSTVNGEMNEKGTMVSRGRLNLMRYHVLVLDDIGQKTDAPPVAPTYKLESSAGSFQWGYALEPGSDLDRFEALIEAIHQKGWGDKGAGGSYRVMRVPGSANIKPGRRNFRSVITEWSPDLFWTLDELAEAFGVDLDKVEVKQTTISTRSGGAAAMEGIDPMLDWLVDEGYVVQDKGAWVDVVCPWHESHTSGSNTGGYSPLGRGQGDWVKTRAYKCLHEHCDIRDLSAFVKWAEKLGGPYVSGYDPLPWLQERYAYVGMDMKVADMHQRVRGGGDVDTWLWDFLPWSKRHPGKVAVPGEKNKIKVADAFVASNRTRHVDYAFYEPVSRADDTGVIIVNHQPALNTYTPPNWKPTDTPPEMFLEHMNYVVPNKKERELFLDWLAFKFQNPKTRSYAMVMVADEVYGTGRSWIKDMLSLALQGKVKTASLAQLIGKGTAAEQNYNDWMSGCQFLIVEEAKETIDRDVFYHGYEVFKQTVDTRVGSTRINPKFGRTRNEKIYFNALIFTNHRDALALPDNDRRVCVLTNATKMNTREYYARLEAATNDEEAARVYWYLMRRDVSDYDHIYPVSTPAKDAMIENNRSPADVLLDYFRDVHWSDLVTKKGLRDMVKTGAAKFDMDTVAIKPGPVTNVIWSKIGTLKDVKNGLRVRINGEQEAIRAIRNKENWRRVADDGDAEKVKEELGKTKSKLKSLIH